MVICGTCERSFGTFDSRDQHCRALGHAPLEFECDTCERYFGSENARWQHMCDCNHFKWECNVCEETWPTEAQCIKHEADSHLYCAFCERFFDSCNGIKMHRNSKIHRGNKMSCPFCTTGFATATGLTHHLEGGGCPDARQLNRDAVYRIVRSQDPNGIISKHFIGWKGSIQYEADAGSYSVETGLFICTLCQRGFRTLESLNQHLSSPAHQVNLYHCPNPGCGQEFKTLAAVINHLESEACNFMRFEEVQKKMGNTFSGNSRLTF
ncbi:hypothetical protein GQ53DRAFT_848797 [Thozetella sp. PMI_491]|nr:hypothetical protein GQ53DRAFT_848797 [Thozetella sp. PMI_491]